LNWDVLDFDLTTQFLQMTSDDLQVYELFALLRLQVEPLRQYYEVKMEHHRQYLDGVGILSLDRGSAKYSKRLFPNTF